MQPFYTFRILFRVSPHHILGSKKKEEQTAEIAEESIISEWVSFWGSPEIMMVGEDSSFIGGILQEFCTSRNIISQTAIPGNHQSLGAPERRHRLFRTITDHVID